MQGTASSPATQAIPKVSVGMFLITLAATLFLSRAAAAAVLVLFVAHLIHRVLTRPPVLASNIKGKRVDITRDGFLPSKLPERVDAIVIGSGVGGLYTAAFLAKLGKSVVVLEQHYIAGGATHAFDASGFEFDTGVHIVNNPVIASQLMAPVAAEKVEWCIMGTEKDGYVHEELLLGDGSQFLCRKSTVFQDLKNAFPKEARNIQGLRRIIDESQIILGLDLVCKTLPRFVWRIVKNLVIPDSWWRHVERSGAEICDEYVGDKRLQAVLLARYGDMGGPPSQVAMSLNVAIAEAFAQDGGGYPIGGPGVFARALIPTIEAAGGRVLVRAPVEKILLENLEHLAPGDRDDDEEPSEETVAASSSVWAKLRAWNPLMKKYKAVGVRVKGHNIYAPLVISGAGAWNTYARLLPRSIVKPWGYLEHMKTAQPSVSHVYAFIGLRGDQSELNLPSVNTWHADVSGPDYDIEKAAMAFFKDPINGPLCGFYCFPSAKDPTYSDRHPGKSNCLCFAETSVEAWAAFADAARQAPGKRGAEYETFKQQVGQRLVDKMLAAHPELKDKIDFIDFATPFTNMHYLNAEHGESLGVRCNPYRLSANAMDFIRPETPVEGLYLSGQDAAIPGVFGAMVGGLLSAQVTMDAADVLSNLPFVSQLPRTYMRMLRHFVESKRAVV
jgi:all-trans-retinol 13,14-reductase